VPQKEQSLLREPDGGRKFVSAERRDQHARRVRYPDEGHAEERPSVRCPWARQLSS
jgi:hypothetical protein